MSAPRLSVQLYTVRELLAEDLPGTLQRLAGIGFTQVEPFGVLDNAEALGRGLEAAGMRAPTAPQRYLDLSPEELDAAFATAACLGIATLIDPHVESARWGTREDVEATAAALNAAAGIAARLDRHDAAQAWSPLTLREFEVARLVARGLTNREIAEELRITARTAGAHLEHIRAKLGAGRRSEIAAWVTPIDGAGETG